MNCRCVASKLAGPSSANRGDEGGAGLGAVAPPVLLPHNLELGPLSAIPVVFEFSSCEKWVGHSLL